MKTIYILIMLVIAATALGCIGNKQAQTSTQTSVSPEQTSISPAEPAGTSAPSESVDSAPATSGSTSDDLFGTDSDLNSVDSLVSDSNVDITLSDSI